MFAEHPYCRCWLLMVGGCDSWWVWLSVGVTVGGCGCRWLTCVAARPQLATAGGELPGVVVGSLWWLRKRPEMGGSVGTAVGVTGTGNPLHTSWLKLGGQCLHGVLSAQHAPSRQGPIHTPHSTTQLQVHQCTRQRLHSPR